MIQTQRITIDIDPAWATIEGKIQVKQGDIGTRFIECEINSSGKPVTLDPTLTVRYALLKPDNTQVYNDAKIQNNIVLIELSEQALTAFGDAACEIHFIAGNTILSTAVFDIKVAKGAVNQNTVVSHADYGALVKATQAAIKATEDVIKTNGEVIEINKTITANEELQTYLTPLLANMNVTSDILAETYKTKFVGYYTARQNLLNEIAKITKWGIAHLLWRIQFFLTKNITFRISGIHAIIRLK